MALKVENINLVEFNGESGETEEVFYCSKCGFKSAFDERLLGICPHCKQPLEVKKKTKLRFLSGNLVGSRLLMRLRIMGEGELKTIPLKLVLTCKDCGEKLEVNLASKELKDVFINGFFQNRSVFLRSVASRLDVRGCKGKREHKWEIDVVDRMDYRFVSVEEVLDFEDLGERKTVVQGVPAILLMKADAKTVEAETEVVEGPDNKLFILIWNGVPIEECGKELKEGEKTVIESIFKGKSLQQLKLIIDDLVAPDVNGREDGKLAAALTAVSPMWIKLNGREEPVPGCLRTLYYGDPRTAKGMIERWFSNKGLALHAYGEATSRTGLVWSIDTDLKVLRWGVLPLADGRMAVLEGIHSLDENEMEQLREVLAQQRVEVRRSLTGSAWVRTRIIADSNTASGRSLKDYLYKCMAIRDSKCFRNPVDITRWNIIIPFGSEDVGPREMYKIRAPPSEEQLKAFKALVKWAWSLKMSDIEVSDEAFSRAVELYEALKRGYEVSDIPIVNNGTVLNIIRLAASYAILSFNTINGKVMVEEKHVNEVYEWFKSILDKWELAEYKRFIEGGEEPSSEELLKIRDQMEEDELKIFREVAKTPGPSDEIGGRLEMAASTVRKHMVKLKELGLVVAGRRGYELSRKGVRFFKAVFQKSNSAETPSKPKLLSYSKDTAICEACGMEASGVNKVEYDGRIIMICDKCFRELSNESSSVLRG